MPISRKNLTEKLNSKVISIYNLQEPKQLFKKCDLISKQFETFFEYSLAGNINKLNELSFINYFEDFAYQVHGYHILDIVAAGVNPQIDFIGVSPPIAKKHLKNIKHYVEIELTEELKFIDKHLSRIKPDIVNISGSESVDDNIFFFESNGISTKLAKAYSKKIFFKWEKFWTKIIKNHSQTTFVVSAGNGGRDWKSDLIGKMGHFELITTPANIKLPNIIVVGSKNQNTLSPFSNYGEMVRVYENGEGVSGFIPCKKYNKLKLTGTSQSTAIHTNRLLKRILDEEK
jgi:hypothetical protein